MSPHLLAGLGGLEALEVVEEAHEHGLVGERERCRALVDGAGVVGVDVLAVDHEVDGAAERVGYLPGRGQRDAALGALDGSLVAGVGGARDAQNLREVLGGAVAVLAAQELERPLADAGACGIWG